MIELSCRFDAPLGRFHNEDYVRALRITARSPSEDRMERFLVGRVAADLVLWADARTDGESLYEICDNDSQGLYEVHEALTHNGKLRDDLEIDEPVEYLLFVHRFVLHPDLAQYRQAVLEAAVSLWGITTTLIVMWKDTTGMSGGDLAATGFRKIAGEDLIYRHAALLSEFNRQNPRGIDWSEIDFTATPEHEKWVRREWKEWHRRLPLDSEPQA